MQEPGEQYEQYKTALRKLSESCEFETITTNEIIRDRLIFGIHDMRVRERLLRENNLTLEKTDKICRSAESMAEQMRVVGQGTSTRETSVHTVRQRSERPERQRRQRFVTKEPTRKKEEPTKECWNCGRYHGRKSKEMCPAYGKICNSCNQKNNFAVKCRQGSNKSNGTSRAVKTITQNDKLFPVRQGATHEECFPVREMATLALDDSQYVTLKLDGGSYMRFQIDSGAQGNVVPLSLYKKATKDNNLNNVSRVKSTLFAFGGSKLQSIGEARIRVVRGNDSCIILCKIVDSEKIRPILGRKACLGMKITQYTYNDELRKPLTGNARVYSVESEPVTKTEIVREYASVFGDGIGEIEGEYSIRLDSSVQPVQHAVRRVPVAIREKLKETLDEMVKSDIITPVEEPTEWISSMVAVTKKDDRLRICLDPKDLNRAIQREHYQLPTIEDIATRLHGAKVLTVLDVKNGF